jgi:hypothetical protein
MAFLRLYFSKSSRGSKSQDPPLDVLMSGKLTSALTPKISNLVPYSGVETQTKNIGYSCTFSHSTEGETTAKIGRVNRP